MNFLEKLAQGQNVTVGGAMKLYDETTEALLRRAPSGEVKQLVIDFMQQHRRILSTRIVQQSIKE